jgi:hypothetical protein
MKMISSFRTFFASLQCQLATSLHPAKIIPERGCPQPQQLERKASARSFGCRWRIESAAAGTAAVRFGCGLAAPGLCDKIFAC